MLAIGLGDKARALLKVQAGEWVKRANAFREQVGYLVASSTLRRLMQRIPQRDDLTMYRKSLEAVRVSGTGNKLAIFSIYGRSSTRQIRKMDSPKSVIYVRARRRLLPAKPEVVILERYSPWTVDTLPFYPKKSEATLLTRKVAENSVKIVKKRREDDRPKWTKELSRAGVRVKKGKVMPRGAVVPDITFDATRLEFGMDRSKPHPHWRPALLAWKRTGLQGILREQSDLISALVGVGFQGWKSWPTPLPEIGLRTAQGFETFQDKLGIR